MHPRGGFSRLDDRMRRQIEEEAANTVGGVTYDSSVSSAVNSTSGAVAGGTGRLFHHPNPRIRRNMRRQHHLNIPGGISPQGSLSGGGGLSSQGTSLASSSGILSPTSVSDRMQNLNSLISQGAGGNSSHTTGPGGGTGGVDFARRGSDASGSLHSFEELIRPPRVSVKAPTEGQQQQGVSPHILGQGVSHTTTTSSAPPLTTFRPEQTPPSKALNAGSGGGGGKGGRGTEIDAALVSSLISHNSYSGRHRGGTLTSVTVHGSGPYGQSTVSASHLFQPTDSTNSNPNHQGASNGGQHSGSQAYPNQPVAAWGASHSAFSQLSVSKISGKAFDPLILRPKLLRHPQNNSNSSGKVSNVALDGERPLTLSATSETESKPPKKQGIPSAIEHDQDRQEGPFDSSKRSAINIGAKSGGKGGRNPSIKRGKKTEDGFQFLIDPHDPEETLKTLKEEAILQAELAEEEDDETIPLKLDGIKQAGQVDWSNAVEKSWPFMRFRNLTVEKAFSHYMLQNHRIPVGVQSGHFIAVLAYAFWFRPDFINRHAAGMFYVLASLLTYLAAFLQGIFGLKCLRNQTTKSFRNTYAEAQVASVFLLLGSLLMVHYGTVPGCHVHNKVSESRCAASFPLGALGGITFMAFVGPRLFLFLPGVAFCLICFVIGIFITDWAGEKDPARADLNPVFRPSYNSHVVIITVHFSLMTIFRGIRELAQRRSFETELLVAVEQQNAEKNAAEVNATLQYMLPPTVLPRLVRNEAPYDVEDASVLQADICGFTSWCSTRTAMQVVEMLSTVIGRFDAVASECGVVRIKTMGDGYLAVCGIPLKREDHAERLLFCAEKMHQTLTHLSETHEAEWGKLQMRIGIHSGQVMGAMLSRQRWAYDVYGAIPKGASVLEHACPVGGVLISGACKSQLSDHTQSSSSLEPFVDLIPELKSLGECFVFSPEIYSIPALVASTGSRNSYFGGGGLTNKGDLIAMGGRFDNDDYDYDEFGEMGDGGGEFTNDGLNAVGFGDLHSNRGDDTDVLKFLWNYAPSQVGDSELRSQRSNRTPAASTNPATSQHGSILFPHSGREEGEAEFGSRKMSVATTTGGGVDSTSSSQLHYTKGRTGIVLQNPTSPQSNSGTGRGNQRSTFFGGVAEASNSGLSNASASQQQQQQNSVNNAGGTGGGATSSVNLLTPKSSMANPLLANGSPAPGSSQLSTAGKGSSILTVNSMSSRSGSSGSVVASSLSAISGATFSGRDLKTSNNTVVTTTSSGGEQRNNNNNNSSTASGTPHVVNLHIPARVVEDDGTVPPAPPTLRDAGAPPEFQQTLGPSDSTAFFTNPSIGLQAEVGVSFDLRAEPSMQNQSYRPPSAFMNDDDGRSSPGTASPREQKLTSPQVQVDSSSVTDHHHFAGENNHGVGKGANTNVGADLGGQTLRILDNHLSAGDAPSMMAEPTGQFFSQDANVVMSEGSHDREKEEEGICTGAENQLPEFGSPIHVGKEQQEQRGQSGDEEHQQEEADDADSSSSRASVADSTDIPVYHAGGTSTLDKFRALGGPSFLSLYGWSFVYVIATGAGDVTESETMRNLYAFIAFALLATLNVIFCPLQYLSRSTCVIISISAIPLIVFYVLDPSVLASDATAPAGWLLLPLILTMVPKLWFVFTVSAILVGVIIGEVFELQTLGALITFAILLGCVILAQVVQQSDWETYKAHLRSMVSLLEITDSQFLILERLLRLKMPPHVIENLLGNNNANANTNNHVTSGSPIMAPESSFSVKTTGSGSANPFSVAGKLLDGGAMNGNVHSIKNAIVVFAQFTNSSISTSLGASGKSVAGAASTSRTLAGSGNTSSSNTKSTTASSGLSGVSARDIGLRLLASHKLMIDMVDELLPSLGGSLLQKVKTIGDTVLIAGCLEPLPVTVLQVALDCLLFLQGLQERVNSLYMASRVAATVGVAIGPAIAAVIGKQQLEFDVFGTTVNKASRIMSSLNNTTTALSSSTGGKPPRANPKEEASPLPAHRRHSDAQFSSDTNNNSSSNTTLSTPRYSAASTPQLYTHAGSTPPSEGHHHAIAPLVQIPHHPLDIQTNDSSNPASFEVLVDPAGGERGVSTTPPPLDSNSNSAIRGDDRSNPLAEGGGIKPILRREKGTGKVSRTNSPASTIGTVPYVSTSVSPSLSLRDTTQQQDQTLQMMRSLPPGLPPAGPSSSTVSVDVTNQSTQNNNLFSSTNSRNASLLIPLEDVFSLRVSTEFIDVLGIKTLGVTGAADSLSEKGIGPIAGASLMPGSPLAAHHPAFGGSLSVGEMVSAPAAAVPLLQAALPAESAAYYDDRNNPSGRIPSALQPLIASCSPSFAVSAKGLGMLKVVDLNLRRVPHTAVLSDAAAGGASIVSGDPGTDVASK